MRTAERTPGVRRAVAVVWAVASGAMVAAGADPVWYVRRDTWPETLLASRQALNKADPAAASAPLPDFGKGSFTVAAWVRTTGDGTILSRAPEKGRWARNGKTFFLRGGRLAFDIGWVGTVGGKTRVSDGQWHHVAVVHDSEVRFFVDGRADAVGPLTFPPDVPEHVVKIGYTTANFPERSGLTGEIDELRVYSRALSAEEIARCLSASPPADGLAGYWPFEKNLSDASGNGNDASGKGCAFVAGKVGSAVSLNGRTTLTARSSSRDARAALWQLLDRDFRSERQRLEMSREREDRIWDGSESGPAALAARYAEAVGDGALSARIRAAADEARDAAGLWAARDLYHRSRDLRDLMATRGLDDVTPLRKLIRQLMAEAGEGYRGQDLLARLDAAEEKSARLLGSGEGRPEEVAAEFERIRHEALVERNPLINFDKLVFVKRLTYGSNHYYTEYINSPWTPGGGLCVLDLKTGEVTDLVPELAGGVFERFDVSFDADRIVFAWKRAYQEGYRLYEIGIDPRTGRRTGGLRQLTFPQDDEAELVRLYRATAHYHHGTDDMHPCYLPDGDIVFISTRCQYGILCDAPDDFTTTVLYRMDGDGKNMRKLSNSSVSEASPAVMPDGRIIYTRWEYVDKGAVSVKCLWAMHPDGSGSVEIYGNDISLPPTFIYARPIPGEADKYVFLGTPHFPQNGVGTVIRLDMSRDIRTRDPMTYITPYADIQAEGGFAFLTPEGKWRNDRNGTGPLFKDPYPLNGRFFLVSHKPEGMPWNDPTGYGLYLLDETGAVYPLYRDGGISCWLPYPLKPRPKPPTPRIARDPELASRGRAVCIVSDVYRGLTGVARGEVKYIRVLEQVPRPWAARRRWNGDVYDQQHVCITKDTHLGLKVQHGVVPVEPDGSAHFTVPAEANIFFQALDSNYMALQTERTFVNYMPGETRSCVGCHETQKDASVSFAGLPAALKRPPSVPGPQPGETSGRRPIHYPTDVQPVLDAHCVKCHSGKTPKAGLDLSGTMTDLFSVSYENLIPERRGGKGRKSFDLVGPTIGENHPKTGNVHYMPAKSFGSHASVLVAMLSKGKVTLADPKMAAIVERLAKQHKDIVLTPVEMLRLTNWVDTNGQYYGSYWGRRNLRYKDHPNFRPVPTFEQAVSMTSPLPEEQR